MNYYHLPNFLKTENAFLDLERKGIITTKETQVLAFYKYYTEELPLHCCTLKNDVVAEYLALGERGLRKVKSHLKELGYISIDGLCVRYLGIDKNKEELQFPPK